MKKTALLVMAAGIGSRFGQGIKQLTSFGPAGEIISINESIKQISLCPALFISDSRRFYLVSVSGTAESFGRPASGFPPTMVS